jgi:adenosylmethionine-8-amino-7-oxononanoate aminotransferase
MSDFDTPAGQHPVVHRSWKRPRPVAVRGEGIYLWDHEGKRYIDGCAGTSVVCNVGHGVRSILDAMYEQGKKVEFAVPHLFTNVPMLRLGQMIVERAPGTMKNNCRAWFSCTGSDAVDDAARLARQYAVASKKPSKYVIISRWQQFHGNHISAAGFAGYTERRRMLYPMFVNSPHIPPAYCYRCYFGDRYPDCGLKCAHALETMIRQTGEENVAAFLAEPVVGAALGALPAPDGYFDVIRDICDRYGVLLMVDEVMTAWGRVGDWFAMEYYGVTPDVVATSKGITAGYAPIASTIAREEVWQVIEDSGVPFMAGHTMAENPIGCAAGVACLEYVTANDLVRNSRETGAYLLRRMHELLDFDVVGDVRGRGLMCAMEFVKDKKTKEPFAPSQKVALMVMQACIRHGLILFPCGGNVDGVAGDMILVTPPLVVTGEQVDEMMDLMKKGIKQVQDQLKEN